MTEVSTGRRRTTRSDGTKDTILDAASRCFADQGYEGTSLDTVAQVAGVTKATVYYHFDSKETLFAGTLTRYLAEALARLEAFECIGGTPTERLARLIDSHIDDTLEPSKRYIAYREYVRTSPETAAAIRDAERRYENACAAVISDGQAAGEFLAGDPKLISMFLIGAVGQTRWYDPSGPVPPAEYRRILTQLLLNGVASGSRRAGN